MKKIFCWLLLLNFVSCYTPAFAKPNINVYVEKIEAGYQFKTVLKHYQPYYLTIVNNEKEKVYLSAQSELKYITESGDVKEIPNDMEIYKRSKKNLAARYFFISLPCMAAGAFITGASFFILTIPGLGLVVAGGIPYNNAVKYNSKFGQDYYIDNSFPSSLNPSEIKNAYVFIPKKENAVKLIITKLSKKNSEFFDLEIPVY